MADLDPKQDYPLSTHRPDLVKTPSGAGLDELSIENLRRGMIAGEDVRATPGTLRLQAEIAEGVNRPQLGENLRRAAEMTAVPDDVILAVYTALRPRRSTASGLEEWARTLEEEFGAHTVASFIREAAAVYERRGLLK